MMNIRRERSRGRFFWRALRGRRLCLRCIWLLAVCTAAYGQDTDVVVNEVFYLGNASEDWVELKNTGSQTVDISTWWFCSRFIYRRFDTQTILVGDDFLLEPGEIIVLTAGIDLNSGQGADMGIYTVNDFSDPDDMVDFMQWGTGIDIGRSDVARDRGLWMELSPGDFDFVPTAAAGETAAYCGTNSGGDLLTTSLDFLNGPPTMGLENNIQCNLEEVLHRDGFEALVL